MAQFVETGWPPVLTGAVAETAVQLAAFCKRVYNCRRSFDWPALNAKYYPHRRSRHLVTQAIVKDESVEPRP